MTSSSSLQLSRGFHAIFLFLFPRPTTSPLRVPLTTLPLKRVRHSFDQGGFVKSPSPPPEAPEAFEDNDDSNDDDNDGEDGDASSSSSDEMST